MKSLCAHQGLVARVRLPFWSAVILWLAALLAPAQNTVHWKTNYYPVTGASIHEIQQSLDRNRPWKDQSRLHGLTEWRVQWRFALTSSPGECRLGSFSTATTITITLPRWIRPTNAPLEIATHWNRYITALLRHESAHATNGLAAAAEQQRRIPALRPESNCEALKTKINGLAQEIVDEHGRRDREYDRLTEHGIKEGATLRGGGRRRERTGSD